MAEFRQPSHRRRLRQEYERSEQGPAAARARGEKPPSAESPSEEPVPPTELGETIRPATTTTRRTSIDVVTTAADWLACVRPEPLLHFLASREMPYVPRIEWFLADALLALPAFPFALGDYANFLLARDYCFRRALGLAEPKPIPGGYQISSIGWSTTVSELESLAEPLGEVGRLYLAMLRITEESARDQPLFFLNCPVRLQVASGVIQALRNDGPHLAFVARNLQRAWAYSDEANLLRQKCRPLAEDAWEWPGDADEVDLLRPPENSSRDERGEFELNRRIQLESRAARRQAAAVRDVIGNPFRSPVFDPAWRSSKIVKLARYIRDEARFEWMPRLGAELVKAGCDCSDMLEHCRGPSPVPRRPGAHVRGCWVLERILAPTTPADL